MKTRQIFSGDLRPRQTNYQQYLRMGQVTSVNAEEGTCSVNWVDVPGDRTNVVLTQADPGNFTLPSIGNFVLCGFNSQGEALILRYLPAGWVARIKGSETTIPPMEAGERYFEATTADGRKSYVYIARTGNIEQESASGIRTGIDDASRTHYVETENSRTITDAGTSFSGRIKRLVGGVVTAIKSVTGNYLTEHRLRVFEYANEALDLTAIPLIDITLGTNVSNSGVILNKTGSYPIDSKKSVVVRIKLKSGVELFIDKEGRVSLVGVKMNIGQGSVDANDSDARQNLEINDTSLGTKGQHVAREHDQITIPLSSSYSDAEHAGLVSLAGLNQAALLSLAASFLSPAGACVFTPGLLLGKVKLEGEITEGAENVIVGDK